MQWKKMICLVLPLAALVGTSIGFEWGGGYFSGSRTGWLILLACCLVIGSCTYFSSERSRMNRARKYR